MTLALPWLKFLEANELVSFLSFVAVALNDTPTASALELLDAILVTLKTSIVSNPNVLTQELSELFALRSLLQHSPVLEDMIATAMGNLLPVAYQGLSASGPAAVVSSIDVSTALAEMRWKRHLDGLPEELDLRTFLVREPWTGSTARIVSFLLYKHPLSRQAYLHWLNVDSSVPITNHDFAMTLYAYLDAASQQGDVIGEGESEILGSRCWNLLTNDWAHSFHDMLLCSTASLFLIVKRSGSKFANAVSALLRHIQSVPNGQLSPAYLVLGRRLHQLFGHDATRDVVTYMVDKSLESVVRMFSGSSGELEDALKLSDELGAFIIVA